MAVVRYSATGDELSLPVALSQAASALDEAGLIASKRQDMEALIQIGRVWVEMANMLATPEEDDESSVEHDTTSRKIGFDNGE